MPATGADIAEANCGVGTAVIVGGSDLVCLLGAEQLGDGSFEPLAEDVIMADAQINNDVPTLVASTLIIGTDQGPAPAAAAVTLDIEPGSTIVFVEPSSFLLVERGNQMIADGTVDAPIVFTSAQDAGLASDLGLPFRPPFTGLVAEDPGGINDEGEWGGLVINGRAPLNEGIQDLDGDGVNETAVGEAGTGLYGGLDVTDNSGVLRFVQVRYAGFEITPDNELNGIALQGVGNGTTVDFVQVHQGSDDGIEFFGGTVNASHLVVTNADDDSIDWVQGWQGAIQYALVVQTPSIDSDQGIEADNLGSDDAAIPVSAPTISNLTIIGNDDGDIGILLREGTAARLYNTIVADVSECFAVDDPSSDARLDDGTIVVESALFDCPVIVSPGGDSEDPAGIEAFLAASNNVVTDQDAALIPPISGGIAYISGATAEAITAFDPTTLNGTQTIPSGPDASQPVSDGFFEPATFVGAVAGTAISDGADVFDDVSGNWTLGWTFGLNVEPEACPSAEAISPTGATFDFVTTSETPSGELLCVLAGRLVEDLTLPTGLNYLAASDIIIGEDQGPDPDNVLINTVTEAPARGVTLTLQPGVTIAFAEEEGDGAPGGSFFLLVERGSQLVADGTVSAPITFTSESADFNDPADLANASGLWGGLVINGRAPVNEGVQDLDGDGENETAVGEAGTGLYGGSIIDDDSGVLNFVRVLFAGFEVTPDNEFNGIAFQGVGNGTVVDSVQVHNNSDDGVEFFGGTVNASRLVITGADDDSIDWVQGWQGSIQFALVVHSPFIDGDQGIEADNLGSDDAAIPVSAPTISNLTIIGQDDGDIGILLREGTAARLANVVVANVSECFAVDDPSSDARLDDGTITLSSALLDCPTIVSPGGDSEDPAGITAFLGASDNVVTDQAAALEAPVAGGFAYISGATADAIPAVDPTTFNGTATIPSGADASLAVTDGFFVPAPFVGAVTDTATNFTLGWTVFVNDPVN
ncbi:MAG: hypothetical protein ACFB22_03735 [Rhodothalassiaceae bacterium]